MQLVELKRRLLVKESSMLVTYPRTSSGRKPDGKQGGQARAHEAYDEDGEANEAGAKVEFNCGICKQPGHKPRNCPMAWWCDKCQWMHKNDIMCDNGAAKTIWKAGFDARRQKQGGGRGRGRGDR